MQIRTIYCLLLGSDRAFGSTCKAKRNKEEEVCALYLGFWKLATS